MRSALVTHQAFSDVSTRRPEGGVPRGYAVGNNCRDVVLRVFGRSESGQLWAHGRAKHCGFDVSRDYWVQFRSTASRRVGHDGHITKYKDTAHMR